MKNIFLAVAMVAILGLFSCSDSSSPNKVNISLVSSISNPNVTPSIASVGSSFDNASAISISSVRILISNVKVQQSGSDKLLNAGPVLFKITDGTKSWEFARGEANSGKVEKIKYEIHRFSSSELETYSKDSIFKDFATPERYTVIIAGNVTLNGTPRAFEYKTEVVGNLSFDLDSSVVINDNLTTIDFKFHPEEVFKMGNVIVDPTDPVSKNFIDNKIKNAIKANKKV